MPSAIFNIAFGSIVEKIRDQNGVLGVLLLKQWEALSAIADHDTVADLLGAAGNTECDFTNYTRKTSLSGTVNVDDVNDRVRVTLPTVTWSNAGGATNNTIVAAVVFQDEGGTDATRVPLTVGSFNTGTGTFVTDGGDITLNLTSIFGYWLQAEGAI